MQFSGLMYLLEWEIFCQENFVLLCPIHPQIWAFFQTASALTVFELETLGLFHLVNNLVAYKLQGHFFQICFRKFVSFFPNFLKKYIEN